MIESFVPKLVVYLLFVNLVLFALMGLDKKLAQRDARRVRERTFFLFALLGGALGGLTGMYAFRHKTKHASFKIGMPLLFALNAGAAFLALYLNGNI